MATYTTTQDDGTSTSSTTTTGLIGASYTFTQTVVVYDSSSTIETATTTTATRSTNTPGTVTSNTITTGLEGASHTFTQSVAAFSAAAIAEGAHTTTTRTASAVPLVEGSASGGLLGDSHAPATSEFVAYDGAVTVTNAAIVPASYFHLVNGTIRTESGEPIENIVWLVATDAMPVATTVNDDGTFGIYLLNQTYERFYITVRDPETDVEVVWPGTGDNPAINPGDEDVELRFHEKQIETSDDSPIRGLMAGRGVSLGL